MNEDNCKPGRDAHGVGLTVRVITERRAWRWAIGRYYGTRELSLGPLVVRVWRS